MGAVKAAQLREGRAGSEVLEQSNIPRMDNMSSSGGRFLNKYLMQSIIPEHSPSRLILQIQTFNMSQGYDLRVTFRPNLSTYLGTKN